MNYPNSLSFSVNLLDNHSVAPDLSRVCRVCMGCSPVMTDIYTFQEDQRICDIIMECVPIQILEAENLPNLICSICLHKLNVSREFRKLCLHSDQILRQESHNLFGNASVSIAYNPQMAELPSEPQPIKTEADNNDVIVVMDENPEVKKEAVYYIFEDETHAQPINVQVMPEDTGTPHKENTSISANESFQIAEVFTTNNNDFETNTEAPPNKKLRMVDPEPIPDEPAPAKQDTLPAFQFVDTSSEVIEILEDDVLQCTKCQAMITNTSFTDHRLVCVNNLRDCPFCARKQLKILDFDRHIQESHIKEFHACKWCRKVFLEDRHFDHHVCDRSGSRELDVNNYLCAFCLKNFANLKAFTCHYYNNHYRKINCICHIP